MIYIKSKALEGHAEKLKEELNYALNKANDEKIAQKQEQYQRIYLQEYMEKTILKLATLTSSTHFNMQWMREEYNLWILPRTMVQQKLLKNLTGCVKFCDKKGDVVGILRSKTYVWKNLSHCNIVLIKRVQNQRKYHKIIQVKIIKHDIIKH